MWVVHSGEVRGEVGTKSRMCYVGWVVVLYVINSVHISTIIQLCWIHTFQSSLIINTRGMTNLTILSVMFEINFI